VRVPCGITWALASLPTMPRTAMQLSSYEEIVAHYRAEWRERALSEARWFQIQPTFRDALMKAGMAEKPSGKRFDHQRRIPRAVLERVTVRLLKAQAQLMRAVSFGELYETVDAALREIDGVGELMIYDTSLRLGAKLGLAPEVVYLHAGARRGARALGATPGQPVIVRAALPRGLRRVSAWELEDILCIYAAELEAIGRATG
jgi:hypothetical protein